MTCYIELNEKSIGLAAAGAAMLGLSLSDGLLQPDGSLRARREARAAAAAPAAAEPVHSPIALPGQPVAPVQPEAAQADDLPEHDIEANYDLFMNR